MHDGRKGFHHQNTLRVPVDVHVRMLAICRIPLNASNAVQHDRRGIYGRQPSRRRRGTRPLPCLRRGQRRTEPLLRGVRRQLDRCGAHRAFRTGKHRRIAVRPRYREFRRRHRRESDATRDAGFPRCSSRRRRATGIASARVRRSRRKRNPVASTLPGRTGQTRVRTQDARRNRAA